MDTERRVFRCNIRTEIISLLPLPTDLLAVEITPAAAGPFVLALREVQAGQQERRPPQVGDVSASIDGPSVQASDRPGPPRYEFAVYVLSASDPPRQLPSPTVPDAEFVAAFLSSAEHRLHVSYCGPQLLLSFVDSSLNAVRSLVVRTCLAQQSRQRETHRSAAAAHTTRSALLHCLAYADPSRECPPL